MSRRVKLLIVVLLAVLFCGEALASGNGGGGKSKTKSKKKKSKGGSKKKEEKKSSKKESKGETEKEKTKSKKRHHTNVSGGEAAPDERFPYMCVMNFSKNPGIGSCSAFLIAPQWVLTAGHCLRDEVGDFTVLEVFCGIQNYQDASAKNDYGVGEIFVHELFDPLISRLRYDIGLIKLERKADEIEFPLINNHSEPEHGTTAYIAGFGEFDDTGVLSDELQFAQVSTIDTTECGEEWNEEASVLVFEEDRICASGQTGSICNGDSGGPLIISHTKRGDLEEGDPTQDIILGISSFGDCENDFPGVFTNIYYFKDWISDIMKNHSS